MDGCELDGIESIKSGNSNCSVPIDRADESNSECAKRFVRGCQWAKIRDFCVRGSSDLLKGRNKQCAPLEDDRSFGHEFYKLCCQVCGKGLEAYANRKACVLPTSGKGKRSKDLEAWAFIHHQFAYCCTSITHAGLISNETEPREAEDDPLGPIEPNESDQADGCASLNCEHSCDSVQGRAFCTCQEGWRLNNDGATCDDIDECSSQPDLCEEGEQCVNDPGSFACKKIVQGEVQQEEIVQGEVQQDEIVQPEVEQEEFVQGEVEQDKIVQKLRSVAKGPSGSESASLAISLHSYALVVSIGLAFVQKVLF